MELFSDRVGVGLGVACWRRIVQHVAVLLTPWGVVHLRDDGRQLALRLTKAEIETDWIEDIAVIAHMGEQSYRTSWSLTGASLHQVSDRLVQRYCGITQVVLATKARQGRPPGGPEPALREDPVELVQVQIHEEKGIAEGVPDGREAPMEHCTSVDGAIDPLHLKAPCRIGG